MKKIVIGALSSLMCISSYAVELPVLSSGVTLIQHTETTGEKLPQQFISMLSTTSASTFASANYTTTTHGSNAYASGNVSGQIRNPDTSIRTYYVDKYMCIANTNCLHTRDTYQLNASASQSLNASLSVTAYMPSKGTFEDEAVISVSGCETSNAKGTNEVVVY